MEPEGSEEELYETSLLQDLDLTASPVSFRNGISISHPGEMLTMRALRINDFDKGFVDHLLGQLTNVADTTKEMYCEKFHAMKKCHDSYYVTVIENTSTSRIIAAATLEVEHKFIRQCAIRGRIEEVVVLEEYRGKQLGKLLTATLLLLSQKLGCYKTTLECQEQNIPFYEKFGLVPNTEVYMVKRFRPK